jgi:nucleotide-binding universal stress UspA family protein
MADRVLVPVDGSEYADRACELVLTEFPGATIVLLHVVNPADAVGFNPGASLPSFSEEWYDRETERAEELFDDVEAAAAERDVPVERAIEVGQPTSTIVDYAGDHDIDHIVMGSHGRKGVSRILLGSVAEAVVRRSPVPVTVVR